MSQTQTNYLEKALGHAQQFHDSLWKDIVDGKLTIEAIREKHENRYEMVSDAIEKATELPGVEVLIHQNEDGSIQSVHSQGVVLEYAVYRDGYEFDKFESHTTTSFRDYEDLLDELGDIEIITEFE